MTICIQLYIIFIITNTKFFKIVAFEKINSDNFQIFLHYWYSKMDINNIRYFKLEKFTFAF